MTEVPAPLFISSRLMAAYRIADVGTLHLHIQGRTADNRIQYKYVIEDAAGNELEEGDDLSSGAGSDPDYYYSYPDMMETLIGFLEAAAERDDDDGEPALFNPAATAWARQHSDELSMARCEIDTDPANHGETCSECTGGNKSPHIPWEV